MIFTIWIVVNAQYSFLTSEISQIYLKIQYYLFTITALLCLCISLYHKLFRLRAHVRSTHSATFGTKKTSRKCKHHPSSNMSKDVEQIGHVSPRSPPSTRLHKSAKSGTGTGSGSHYSVESLPAPSLTFSKQNSDGTQPGQSSAGRLHEVELMQQVAIKETSTSSPVEIKHVRSQSPSNAPEMKGDPYVQTKGATHSKKINDRVARSAKISDKRERSQRAIMKKLNWFLCLIPFFGILAIAALFFAAVTALFAESFSKPTDEEAANYTVTGDILNFVWIGVFWCLQYYPYVPCNSFKARMAKIMPCLSDRQG